MQEFATAGGLGSLLVLKFATSFCPDFLAYLWRTCNYRLADACMCRSQLIRVCCSLECPSVALISITNLPNSWSHTVPSSLACYLSDCVYLSISHIGYNSLSINLPNFRCNIIKPFEMSSPSPYIVSSMNIVIQVVGITSSVATATILLTLMLFPSMMFREKLDSSRSMTSGITNSGNSNSAAYPRSDTAR